MIAHCAVTRRAAAFLPLVLALACTETAPDAASAPELAGGVVNLFTDSTELFMEHPALIVGDSGKFAVHLTDLTDFAPIRSGRVTMHFEPRDGGESLEVVQETPRAPGIYGPAPRFARAGTYDLTIIVESPQARDRIAVPGLVVYATAADAPRAEEEVDDGSIPFLKEQQWKAPAFRTAAAVAGTLAARLDVPGDIVAAAERQAQIVALAGGVLDVASAARVPLVGDRVAAGDIVAYLRPSLGSSGATFADARARLREAEEEYDRAKRLSALEAIPARRLHEAEIELAAAREALAAAGGGNLEADGRLAIRAPIAGVVTASQFVAGARVDIGAPLFSIVEPGVVHVVAHVPSGDIAQLQRDGRATVTPEGTTQPAATARPRAVGVAIDAATRTVPVTYEATNSVGALRVGSHARVGIPTRTQASGVLVPASAILEDEGRPYLYIQVGGESYARRDITVSTTDGFQALVVGVAAGERVVSGSAYAVRLASLSTAVPAHGHEH